MFETQGAHVGTVSSPRPPEDLEGVGLDHVLRRQDKDAIAPGLEPTFPMELHGKERNKRHRTYARTRARAHTIPIHTALHADFPAGKRNSGDTVTFSLKPYVAV